ncbi:ribosomal-processing cysteine protease Prp [Lactococcus hircilactis]|uniref:Ribosomal processing cysteine protease Prp n=1 Tax=Lactococcus hircilactis TaxID=1494462 RepID=A0A7X1ZC43_9LACT|nr:ribosomal-processing cysteine protease Prp [Lactococcus hircilactis]MQW40577.1 ribosomal-processing cysteine protease Prp [Lactococcus hircilactis]
MITAKFKKQNNQIYWYQVTGHAGFANIGNDIVCAGVSVLYITVTNTLLAAGRTFERDEGYFVLDANDYDMACLKVLYDGIKAIAEQYPENVKVEE